MIKHDKKFLIDFLGLHPIFRSEKKAPSFSSPVLKLNKIKEKVKNCKKCSLHETRNSIVFGDGYLNRPWMFIGEAPGESEDVSGKPFVGAAGKLLDKMILAMKLKRDKNTYITNVIKCRPPHNRNPNPIEINNCQNYLSEQINLINPLIIITLGKIAANSILKNDLPLNVLRGKIHHYNNIAVLCTYHPSYLLRNTAEKKKSWEDLCLALDFVKERGNC
jgi:DNA polymerase